ncbi:hypothetical protein MNL06_07345 [Bartonella krasnovii]|uniref:type IV secretion system protein n=1 Tax=Bartonella krasnovii TaxID=2267275 RepID=UPI001F4C66EF|nr:type IV secretion system protein [Bartonella krasnovii]UNF45339.1 hypothetical protein MNL06_07345 [Bartonella krasnovii]
MKKTSIVIGNIIFWVMLNIAPANADPANAVTLEKYQEIIALLKQQLDLKEKQLSAIGNTYEAITYEPTITDQDIQSKKEMYNKLFLKDLSLLDKKDKHSDALRQSYQEILKNEENIVKNQRGWAKNLLARLQYASVTDRAVSLHALRASEQRFEYILSLLEAFEKVKDLQEIADFQANLDGILAMIENESIKLQIVAQLRDAEYALIRMQRNEIDLRIFDSANTKMPSIRF